MQYKMIEYHHKEICRIIDSYYNQNICISFMHPCLDVIVFDGVTILEILFFLKKRKNLFQIYDGIPFISKY